MTRIEERELRRAEAIREMPRHTRLDRLHAIHDQMDRQQRRKARGIKPDTRFLDDMANHLMQADRKKRCLAMYPSLERMAKSDAAPID